MLKIIIPLLLICTLLGCGKPVPADKSNYVGEWQRDLTYIQITKEGAVRYRKKQGNVRKSIDGPLKGFVGDNFEVGVGPLAATFVVSKPPYQVDGKWKMVVDDEELTKVSE